MIEGFEDLNNYASLDEEFAVKQTPSITVTPAVKQTPTITVPPAVEAQMSGYNISGTCPAGGCKAYDPYEEFAVKQPPSITVTPAVEAQMSAYNISGTCPAGGCQAYNIDEAPDLLEYSEITSAATTKSQSATEVTSSSSEPAEESAEEHTLTHSHPVNNKHTHTFRHTNKEDFSNSSTEPDYAKRASSVNLILKALLFACLFYVLAHPDTYTQAIRKMSSKLTKEHGLYICMAVFAVVYYIIGIFL